MNDKDHDGKKFDRVSRIKATSVEDGGAECVLDINDEVFPIDGEFMESKIR